MNSFPIFFFLFLLIPINFIAGNDEQLLCENNPFLVIEDNESWLFYFINF